MKKFFPALQTLILALSACAAAIPASATPSSTPTPAALVPTVTPTSTPPPTADFDVNGIDSLVVEDGFTISVPLPLVYQTQNGIVLIANEDQTLSISFVGDQYDGSQSLEEVMNGYLGSLEKRGAQFSKSETVEIQIDGSDGIAMDLTGKLNNVEVQGRAVIISPRPDFSLFGMALSKVDPGRNIWEDEHAAIFEDLLKGIRFPDVNAACVVSTDQSYGYTEKNPIKVGGGDFDGPSRERAYLDHLFGPNGEILSYERNGSIPAGDVILDVYQLSATGINLVLYIDEYNFAQLQAPVGFSCRGAFPLSAP
jgi:hypothetical protein